MGKGLHKVFSTILREISQELTALGKSGSEVSHFIPEPINFSEVTKLSENINNFVTSANFIGSGMRWETSKPDSPKGVNSCKLFFYNRTKYLV